MKLPMVFEPYEPARADVMFPMIDERSTHADVISYSWMHALYLMRNDHMILRDAFIGEYRDRLEAMGEHPGEVIKPLAEHH